MTLNVQHGVLGYDVPIGACTDASGQYTIYNAPLNVSLKITAARDSWNWCDSVSQDHLQEWWQDTPNFDDATPITLLLGSRDATGVDFTLDLGGTISGYVYESDGVTPVAGEVWINAQPTDGSDWIGAPVSGDGSYTIAGLPPGDYWLRAEGADYALEFYDEAGGSGNNATIISVGVGSSISNVDFTLDPGGTISGTVYEADGVTPVANMFVRMNEVWKDTCTDANGHYTLYNLPLNKSLNIISGGSGNWCGGSQDLLEEWWQEATSAENATPITLTSGTPDATGIDFTLDLGGTVSGHVYESDGFTPAARAAWVNAEPPTGGNWFGTQVNADGSYTIHGVAAGNYWVRADGDGYAVEYYDEAGSPLTPQQL